MISFVEKIYIQLILTIFLATSTFANNITQIVQISSNVTSVKSGENLIVYANYNVSDGSKTTGIGIEIHYNSEYFELLEIDSYLEGYQDGLDKIEEENTDEDPLTDRVISMAWSSLGYNTWPYLSLPLELTRLTFKVRKEMSKVQTWINVTATSTSGHNPFEGKNLQFNINPMPNVDINKDGYCNLKDVIQTIKYLINK